MKILEYSFSVFAKNFHSRYSFQFVIVRVDSFGYCVLHEK